MYGIVANVKTDKAFRTGAKVYLMKANQGADNVEVIGLSKSGRRITKYIPYKRLENFRAAWIPEHYRSEAHLYTKWGVCCYWEKKEDAQDAADKLAAMWAGVRYFSADGTRLMEDGVTTNVAYERAREMHAHEGKPIKCIPLDVMVAGHQTHKKFESNT